MKKPSTIDLYDLAQISFEFNAVWSIFSHRISFPVRFSMDMENENLLDYYYRYLSSLLF